MHLESAQSYFCDQDKLDWEHSLVFAEPSLHIDGKIGHPFLLTKNLTAEIVEESVFMTCGKSSTVLFPQ